MDDVPWKKKPGELPEYKPRPASELPTPAPVKRDWQPLPPAPEPYRVNALEDPDKNERLKLKQVKVKGYDPPQFVTVRDLLEVLHKANPHARILVDDGANWRPPLPVGIDAKGGTEPVFRAGMIIL